MALKLQLCSASPTISASVLLIDCKRDRLPILSASRGMPLILMNKNLEQSERLPFILS